MPGSTSLDIMKDLKLLLKLILIYIFTSVIYTIFTLDGLQESGLNVKSYFQKPKSCGKQERFGP